MGFAGTNPAAEEAKGQTEICIRREDVSTEDGKKMIHGMLISNSTPTSVRRVRHYF